MKQILSPINAQMLRMVQGDAPVDHVETIRMYLVSEPGTVTLTDMQQKMLARYEYADNLMRDRKNDYTTVVQRIQEDFQVNAATARTDIARAQYLFGSAFSRNKTYLLAQHYDLMTQVQQKLIDKEEYKEAAAFGKIVTDIIKLLPDDHRENNKAAAIIYNISLNNYADLTGKEPDADAARRVAAKYFEDIDYELIP